MVRERYDSGDRAPLHPLSVIQMSPFKPIKKSKAWFATVRDKVAAGRDKKPAAWFRRIPMPLQAPYCSFLASLGSRNVTVIKPMPVTMEQRSDGEYIATFLDANIASGGETKAEAIQSLQDLIEMTFESILDLSDDQLGPQMKRTKAVLTEFLCLSPSHTP